MIRTWRLRAVKRDESALCDPGLLNGRPDVGTAQPAAKSFPQLVPRVLTSRQVLCDKAITWEKATILPAPGSTTRRVGTDRDTISRANFVHGLCDYEASPNSRRRRLISRRTASKLGLIFRARRNASNAPRRFFSLRRA